MTDGKRKVLVIGNVFRIKLPRMIKERAAPLIRPKLRIGKINIPIVFILVAALLIFPIGMAFGAGTPTLLRNLVDSGNPANSLVDITKIEFHTGTPSGGGSLLPPPSPEYPDGTEIEDGDFYLYFEWQMKNPEGPLLYGDYFDLILDLGIEPLADVVIEKLDTVSPVIYAPDGTTVLGYITWLNESVYQSEQRITIRVTFDSAEFQTVYNGELYGSEDDPVCGTGYWGFKYTAESGGGGSWETIWQVRTDDGRFHGHIIIRPKPKPGQPPSGNERWNPYDKLEKGYKKFGSRLSSASTPVSDQIFYWDIYLNGHKHATIADWNNCPDKANCPALPNTETITLVDSCTNMAPTWLRDVTEAANGTPVIHPETALTVNRGGGLYGQTVGATSGPAYFKLFYVNSEYIWQDRIDYTNSPYETPANDTNPKHKPSTGHPVGEYDPYFTTWTMQQGERGALVTVPNYTGSGQRYYNYLTPVPASAIRSITLTEDGWRMELLTSAVLGKTLAIAYMTKPVPGAGGNYSQNVHNTLSIVDVNNGDPIVEASGAVLIGGTVQGSPNKGKFILEKRDNETMELMPGVSFDIIASSENEALADAAQALIDDKRGGDPPGSGMLVTGADGKISIDLPPQPWGGKNLLLEITEIAPPGGHIGLKGKFTVTIEPVNRTVIQVTPQYTADASFISIASDHYGVVALNREFEEGDYYDAALRKWIKMVTRMVGDEETVTFFRDEVHWDDVNVMNGDKILYRIDLYNQCRNNIIIPEISDWFMGVGLKFDPDTTMPNTNTSLPPYNNQLWAWAPAEAGKPPRLMYIGEPVYLEAWDGTGYNYPEYRIPLILTVDVPDDWPDGKRLANIAEISKLWDEDGNEVEDIDSTPDDDPFNDGYVPCWDYDDDPPDGTVKQHEIEEHRKDADGNEDPTQDEDDHDFACVIVGNPPDINCQVDKDTIRRTSAAFDGRPYINVNNVGEEAYRYDVAFRSTSRLAAEEFVVDDPLENVDNDQVRIQSLWTPIAWGDEDGKYNIWYKTNKTNDGTTYSDVKATGPGVVQRWPNTGFKLWKQDLPAAGPRERLDVADLGLSSGEYITALRFEYGAVKVGFTCRNTPHYSLNGEHRAPDGSLTLPPEDLALINSFESGSGTTGNFFTRLFGSLFGSSSSTGGVFNPMMAFNPLMVFATDPGDPDSGIGTPPIGPDLDWTPDPARQDYAQGAADATGLKPAQYLVTAVRAMETENIVSSAEAKIARGDLWAMDVDAVVTREISPFEGEAEEEPGYTLTNTFNDNIPRLNPSSDEGVGGRSTAARTFDEMSPLFWIALAAVAAAGIFLLSFMVWLRRRRRVVAMQTARRRQDR